MFQFKNNQNPTNTKQITGLVLCHPCEGAVAPSVCEKMSRKLFKIVNKWVTNCSKLWKKWVANFSKLWTNESWIVQNCQKMSRKLFTIVKIWVTNFFKLWTFESPNSQICKKQPLRKKEKSSKWSCPFQTGNY